MPHEVDAANAPQIRDGLLTLLNKGSGPLIIDLSGTRFCDCAGARAIARANQRAVGLRTRVWVVLPADGPVRKIAELTGLTRRLPVVSSVTAAHEAMRDDHVPRSPGSGAPKPSRRSVADVSSTSETTITR